MGCYGIPLKPKEQLKKQEKVQTVPTARTDDRITFLGLDISLTNLPKHRRPNEEKLSRNKSIEPVPRLAKSV